MALRYNGILIDAAREDTGETDYSATNGITQNSAVEKLREAVIHCQQNIFDVAPHVFDVLTEISGVANQNSYDLPENTYIGASLIAFEYSKDGTAEKYYPLELKDYIYRANKADSEPRCFIPYGERSVLVDPFPDTSNGKFRATHGAYLDAPDIRRGKIATVNSAGASYTTLVLEDDTNLDETKIATDEYLCVSDKDGTVVFYNANYSYDTGTKTLTLTGALVADGDIDVGDYITIGRYTTTHIKLHKHAEPVVLSYLRRAFYLRKSSADADAEMTNLKSFTNEMVNAYFKRNRMQKKVPYIGKFENV